MHQLLDSASPIITFESISFNHAGRELHGISCSAYASRVTFLMGPHDAGKTTILRILMGLDIPDSGYISTYGKALWHIPYAKKRCKHNVRDHLTILALLGRNLSSLEGALDRNT